MGARGEMGPFGLGPLFSKMRCHQFPHVRVNPRLLLGCTRPCLAWQMYAFAPTRGTKFLVARDLDQAVAGVAIFSFNSVQVLRTSAVICEQSSI
jgi:hypothetical protein